jgi:hypothetical protein
MAWFFVDDAWHCHPKVIAAGNAAAGLWARCGSYCSQQNLEGRIPKLLATAYGTRAEINRLIAVGLWLDEGDVYVMHDWTDYNRSRREAMEQRSKRAEAGRLGGLRSGEARRSKPPPDSEANAEAESKQMLEANVNPVLSSPVQSLSRQSSTRSGRARNGTRTDDDAFMKTINILVEHKAREHPPRSRRAWERTTVPQTIEEDGPQVRAHLEAQCDPITAAGLILGSRAEAELAAGRL